MIGFGIRLALCGLACCATLGNAWCQETAERAARAALQRSDFVGALEASLALPDGTKAKRLRLDTLYAAGDMAGALGAAIELKDAASGDPYGAFMATRLALDLGYIERGEQFLGVFRGRLEATRDSMPQETAEWYGAKAEGLEEQARGLRAQVEAERSAGLRARVVVLLAGLVVAFLALRSGRRMP